jgi:hypothetical protein
MTGMDVPAQLVAELAIGVDSPDEIASRFGIDGRKWEALKTWKPFLDAIDQQRAEFERSGYTFRVKSAMKADAISDALFVQAMRNDATLLQRLEALKVFAKLGELEPNPKATAPTGPTFSITIDLGSQGTKTIQATATVSEPEQIEAEDAVVIAEEAPEAKPAFKVPDFDLSLAKT